MADIARGQVEVTPVVLIAADADADAVEAIHHDVGGSLGGALEYEKADANDKWFYQDDRNVTTDTNLIDGDFTEGGSTHVADIVKFLYVEHTGFSSTGAVSTATVCFTLDGGDPGAEGDVFLLDPNESLILKFDKLTLENLHCYAKNSSIVKILAIIDDVA